MTSFQTSEGEQQQAFLYSNIVDSTFPHQPKAGGPPFLSRTGNVLYAFIRANIQELTFHQTNYCSRLQTIRWFRRSDWKPSRLPFRLKELRTFACFPTFQHSGFYFPPAEGWSPSLSREENVLHAFLRSNIQELTFHQTNCCGSPQTIR